MSRAAKVAIAVALVAAVTIPLARRRSQESSEDVLRAFYDAWADGDVDAVDDLVADDYCGHIHTISGTEEQDAKALARRVKSHAASFDDLEFELEDVLARNGEVAARITLRAHHRESGREATTVGLAIARVEDGKIAEEWASWDYLGLAEQLGLRPLGDGQA